MVNIFTRIKKGINNLPLLRRPEYTSRTDKFFDEYGWIIQPRNKSLNIGWSTYYKAMKNVWVNACIQTYIDEVINLGFMINDPTSDEVNYAHVSYLNGLFQNPMGLHEQDTYAMYQSLMWRSYLGLGDAFSEVVNDPTYKNVPIGFKHIPTEYMMWYEDTSQWGFVNFDYRFENDELIHIKDPDIRGSVWGESKIDVIAKDLTLEILGRDHTLDILKGSGLDPSGVIEYGSEVPATQFNQELQRLKAESKAHGKGTIILRGAKYNRAGVSNRDMEYTQLMNDVRDRIIATYGVPPAKVSIIETANLGTGSGSSQDKQFKKTLKGKAKNFEDAYSRVLGRCDFKEIFQYGDLDIEDKQQRAAIEDTQIRNGSLTINESRLGYGMPAVEWGNVPLNYTQYGLIDNGNVTSLGETSNAETNNATTTGPTAKTLNNPTNINYENEDEAKFQETKQDLIRRGIIRK